MDVLPELRVLARLVAVPRPPRVRWLTVLDPVAAAAYRARVGRIAPAIEAALGPGVMANRVRGRAGPATRLRLEPWRAARRRFIRAARTRATSGSALLVADVRDCFARIMPEVVADRLLELGAEPAGTAEVVRCLEAFRAKGVAGLPVGPEPSAVLANAVLEKADRAVAEAEGDLLRWVDDFLVFARGRRHAMAILDRLGDSLESLGLSLSVPKTRIVEEAEGARVLLSSVDISDVYPRL